IERHMGYFYDSIREDGTIVLDDYGDFIDRRGLGYIEDSRGRTETEIRDDFRRLDRRALGKHLLTYYIAGEMERIGMIKLRHVIQTTAFYRKPTSRPFADFDLSGIRGIEAQLEDMFVNKCISVAS